MLAIPNYNEPLPQVEGPKLHPFRDNRIDVKLKRLLFREENTPSSSDEGPHSYVFEAVINSKTYALKIFRFYDEVRTLEDMDDDEYDKVGDEILRAHADPFFAECRAYGRLIEENLNGKVAAYCHGYLALPPEMEETIDRRFPDLDFNRLEREYRRSPSKRQPFRAIVKDLLLDEVPLTSKSLRKMLKDLKTLRKHGIYPVDIAARNYKAGLLVDFSIAMTTPYFLFDIRPKSMVRRYKNQDFDNFDRMVEAEGVRTSVRALPNQEIVEKLRSRTTSVKYKETRTYRRMRRK